MRGDIIFQVFGARESRPKDVYFGAFRTRKEAEEQISHLRLRVMHGSNWAERYHNKGFVIRGHDRDDGF